jgi:hypothetical protein
MDSRWQTATLEFSDGAQQTLRDDGEFGLYRTPWAVRPLALATHQSRQS